MAYEEIRNIVPPALALVLEKQQKLIVQALTDHVDKAMETQDDRVCRLSASDMLFRLLHPCIHKMRVWVLGFLLYH